MAVSLYNTGVSGLLAAQQQLAVTGQNIANVNTEGYNRQRAEQNTTLGIFSGGNYIGSGTYIQDITRIYDQFSYKEQLLSQSNLSNADSLHIDLSQLNEIMSFSSTSINNSIDQLYQSINSIADNPSDFGLRNIALSQADILGSDFRSLNENFDLIEKSVNGEIEQIASQISEISLEIAKINEQILQSNPLDVSGKPNDLLDKRDQLITALGSFTSVKTLESSNGVMTVMIGNGTTLVAGITPLTIRVNAGDPDPKKTTLNIVGANGIAALKGTSLGGSLAGKFEFRDEHLSKLRSEINQISMSISETFNASQHDGLDLNAQEGNDFFTNINTALLQQSRVLIPSTNVGNLQASINITDITLVPSDEFEVRYDGANYMLTNLNDGSVLNLGASGAGTYTVPSYGFEFIENSGAPTINDTLIIRPTENSASLMKLVLASGAGIAASSAVEVRASDNNISSGSIDVVSMLDPVNARAAMPMRIDVLESPAGVFNYTYTDNLGVTSPSVAYTPPAQIINLPPLPSLPLFAVEIKGNPSGAAANAPEQFFIDDAFGLGNGGNAVAMALTQEKGIINGEQETFNKSLSISTADIGSKAKSAELVADAAQSMFTQAFNRNQEISGVNLDEEAANLMKFQQAYQASSRIIAIANTIFDTLLQAVR